MAIATSLTPDEHIIRLTGQLRDNFNNETSLNTAVEWNKRYVPLSDNPKALFTHPKRIKKLKQLWNKQYYTVFDIVNGKIVLSEIPTYSYHDGYLRKYTALPLLHRGTLSYPVRRLSKAEFVFPLVVSSLQQFISAYLHRIDCSRNASEFEIQAISKQEAFKYMGLNYNFISNAIQEI